MRGVLPYTGVLAPKRMKIALHVVVIAILVFGWGHMLQARSAAAVVLKQADAASNIGQFESSDRLRKEADQQESQAAFTGILLAFLTSGYVGLVFVAYILPVMANKVTHAMFESGESVEPDAMHDARVLVAQGKYAEAVEAFRLAAGKEEGNRVPWLEMAKLQREQLDDSLGATATLREALEDHTWNEDDAGFLLFRLAELYAEALDDEEAAAEVLGQLIEQFPNTRHSANARHRLQQWGRGLAPT